MPEKTILYCGQDVRVACDLNCSKAWGMQSRPCIFLSAFDAQGNRNYETVTNEDGSERMFYEKLDPDDWFYLPDQALGRAPVDPGTSEGDETKPLNATDADDMNKWCVRQCERCQMSKFGMIDKPVPNDLTKPQANIPASQKRAERLWELIKDKCLDDVIF